MKFEKAKIFKAIICDLNIYKIPLPVKIEMNGNQ